MNGFSDFRMVHRGVVRVLVVAALACRLHATPVFEPVHGLALSPKTPMAALVKGSDGHFYGTTDDGGSNDSGTVFKISTDGTLTTLVDFNSTDGSDPSAALVDGGDGYFYGTTANGGSNNYGTVFRMNASGVLTTLVSFNSLNGSYPNATLIKGNDGYFYGTTVSGGGSGFGTVFKMTDAGTLTTLVNFNSTNGSYPYAALIEGSPGQFFGVTTQGGIYDRGTVFKVTSGGILTTLVDFNFTNGSSPRAALVKGSDGNFYGTTLNGGSNDSGTVFKMTALGEITTLVHFDSNNGSNPAAALIQGNDGNFHGTTVQGGASDFGTIFRMTPSGTLTTSVHFDSSNGRYPYAALVEGPDGNFYGTTQSGGSTPGGQLTGGGQIFRIRLGPSVTSQPVTGLFATKAKLNGKVNPGGYVTPVNFQYGTSPTLADFTTVSAGTLPIGDTDAAVLADISDLVPNTDYYFRVLASNVENPVPRNGSILTFKTPNDTPDIGLEAPAGTAVENGAATLSFGSMAPGQTADKALTLLNTGLGIDLATISLSLAEPGTSAFSVVTSPPASIAAGMSAPFTIRFSPASLGPKTATLSIASNDPDEDPFTIDLSGTGVTVTEAWRYQYFSTIHNTGDAADNADPDDDGLLNLLERAFNLHPTQPGNPILTADSGLTGLPLVRMVEGPGGRIFSIQYLRRKASSNPGLSYTPQFSSSLGDTAPDGWLAATGSEIKESINAEWERVTVEENADARQKRFGRVKVVADP